MSTKDTPAPNTVNESERQYLPSLSVPDAPAIFDQWRARAAATREKLKFSGDIRYGDNPREVMDFFPAANARGCVVFIHGGYWVSFSKNESSWMADGFVGQGLSVALINYPLCPEVSIADIRASCAKAFVHLYTKVLSPTERNAIVVTGHSAGGHLAAALLTEDWAKVDLPHDPIKGVISLSGVFDVAPLINTRLNANLRLEAASAAAVNVLAQQPRSKARLALAVGEQESEEFHRQSADLAANWAALKPQLIDVKGTHHFNIVDALANPQGELNRLAVAMVRS